MTVSLGPTAAETAQADAARARRAAAGRGRVAVPIEELRRAWAAVVAGEFRHPTSRPAPTPPRAGSLNTAAPADTMHARRTATTTAGSATGGSAPRWRPEPAERVLPVIGCVGSCGATTLALAVATAANTQGRRARVVECASLSATGLAGASTSELGTDLGTRRARGIRDAVAEAAGAHSGRGVVLERVGTIMTRADEVPPPTVGGFDLTVVDAGWEPGQLLATPSWITDQVLSQPGLAVTTATAPGLRRLEVTLSMLPCPRSWCVAVVGPRRRRWASSASREIGPLTAALLDAGRLIEVPPDRHLATAGLSGDPLPRALVAAAAAALDHLATFSPHEHSHDDYAEAIGADDTKNRTQEGTS